SERPRNVRLSFQWANGVTRRMTVGPMSMADQEDMIRAITANRLKPVIDRRFSAAGNRRCLQVLRIPKALWQGLLRTLRSPPRLLDDSRDNRSVGASVPDVANSGLVRPPLVYLSSIALGLVLHLLWPARLVPPSVSTPVGAIVTVLAIALFVSAVRILRAAGTPVPGNRPTTTIVRTGPYRLSRNPIHLPFSLVQLGLSLWVNSLALLRSEERRVGKVCL